MMVVIVILTNNN